MKTLYCLGLHKTGSTSLQHFLLANQLELGRSGVLYPPVHPEGSARLIAQAFGGLDVTSRPARLNEYMGHNALAYQLIADAIPDCPLPAGHAPMSPSSVVLDHVADLARQMQARTLIFCSEDFATAGLRAPEIPQLFSSRFGDGPCAIFAIIRRPDEALSSWQSQILKFRNPFPSLAETGLGPWLNTVHIDYRSALSPWLAQFPQAERHILPYDVVKAGGGAVAVFEDTFSGEFPNSMHATKDSNSSLPYAMIEIARIALSRLPPRQAVKVWQYLFQAAKRVRLPRNQDVDLLGAMARVELAAVFSECHNWLGQISGRKPFFDDWGDMVRPRVFDGRTATAEILPALLHDAEIHMDDPNLQQFLQELDKRGP